MNNAPFPPKSKVEVSTFCPSRAASSPNLSTLSSGEGGYLEFDRCLMVQSTARQSVDTFCPPTALMRGVISVVKEREGSTGLERSGVEWSGQWSGECNGVEWSGVEWSGVE